VDVVVRLWNANIKADFNKAKQDTVEKQKEDALEQRCSFAVVIQDPFIYTSMLQVCNLSNNQVLIGWFCFNY
jgi:hypothetical protein